MVEKGEPKEGETIFITSKNKPLHPVYVEDVLHRVGLNLGLISQEELKKLSWAPLPHPTSYVPQTIQKRSISAGRGIDQRYFEFFMGHAGGLAQIGGIYDRSPELHEDIFEKEYRQTSNRLHQCLLFGSLSTE